MKRKLILFLLLICGFKSYNQILLDPTLPNGFNVNSVNTALSAPITASGTDSYLGALHNITNANIRAYDVLFLNANTGASTFNLNSVTDVPIKKYVGGTLVDLVAGDISDKEVKRLRYYNYCTCLVIEGGISFALPSQTSNSGKFLTTNGTSPSWAANFTWDGSNYRLNVGNGNSVAGNNEFNLGTGTAMSSLATESFSSCEACLVRASNTASFGKAVTVGDNTNAFSGKNSLSSGIDNLNYGISSVVSGRGARVLYGATGVTEGGFVHSFYGGALQSLEYVTASGGAGNMSSNTSAQTSGHGSLAKGGFIVGGEDANIPLTAINSFIGGGRKMKMISTDTSVAYFPNLRVRSGVGTGTRMMVFDALGHVGSQAIASGSVTSVTGTLPISVATGTTTPVISIADAVADGATKGASTFTATDFNTASGVVTIDYTNGQAGSASLKGFITTADWSTFNSKVSGSRNINTTAPLSGGGDLSADRTLSISQATTSTNGYVTSTDWNTFNNKVSSQWVTTGSDIYYNAGNVMVGTNAAPSSKLQVVETSTATPRGVLVDQYNTGTQGARITMRKARGTFASPTVIITGDALASWTASGYDGANFIESGKILSTSAGTIGTNTVPSKMDFQTANSSGTLTTGISIDQAQALTFPAYTTNGGLHYSNSSGVLLQTGAGTSTTLLHGGTTPSYSAVALTTDVSGLLPYANFSNGAGLSVAGRSTNSSGVQADIIGTTDQILRVNGAGTTLGFGSIDLSKSAAVGSSILPIANGGTGSSNFTGWLLASGGTLTGANTISSTTPSGLLFTNTWTATANTQNAFELAGNITSRNTNSDALNYMVIDPTLTRNAGNPTTQNMTALLINPTFSNAASNSTYQIKIQSAGADVFNISTKDVNIGSLGAIVAGTALNVTSESSSAGVFAAIIQGGGVTSSGILKLKGATGNNAWSFGSDGTLIGFQDPSTTATNFITLTQGNATSGGTARGFLYTSGAPVSQAGEVLDFKINTTRAVTFANATSITDQRSFFLGSPTYSAQSGSATVTNMYSGWIAGATINGGGLTVTNTYGLFIGSNAVGTVTNSYGAFLNAQTGATNNFALGLSGNFKMAVANRLFFTEGSNGIVGQTILVAGVSAVTVTGVTTASRCLATLVSQAGTVTTTSSYSCACTANTVTVTAVTNAIATNTLDTSTLNYFFIN